MKKHVCLYFLFISLLCSCGFSNDNISDESKPPEKQPIAENYILLPKPHQIEYLPGKFQLEAGRFIWLDMKSSEKLFDVGLIIQQSLAQAGQKLELTAAQGNDPCQMAVMVSVNPAQIPCPEGYRLSIRPEQIRIVAGGAAGAFYAAQTLKQICRQADGAGELDCLRINDWPDFPNRGVMLDISRDQVPKMETLYELIDLLSEWKINQFQLYTEHTFAYRNHRDVWEHASPMTAEQILALDKYCREHFIELVPNQNSFGHMQRWLKHERYLNLAEAPEGCQTEWGWMEPFSLCPLEPGSIKLIEELYDELLPNFSSMQFNVGCDETVDLGKVKSKQICEKLGTGQVYLNFLLEIHKLVRRHGRTMQFWGDIVLKHPELIKQLPPDIIALAWGYEADHPFAEECRKFAEAGVPFYVCPGMSTWCSITGRTDNALKNLWSAAENGLANRAVGYLNTNWGDHGTWQPLPVCYLGYAYGAAVSWSAQANRDIDLPKVLDIHAFRDKAGLAGQIVYDLGNAYKETGVEPRNQTILYRLLKNPDASMNDQPYSRLTPANLEKTISYIDRVVSALPRTNIQRPDAQQIIDELTNAAALLKHACRLGIARLEAKEGKIGNIPEEKRKELAQDLKRLLAEHQRLWLLRSRQGGLTDSVAGMEKLLKAYQI